MGQYRPGPSMVTTVTRVFVSPAPATIAYLGLGRGWWVPLLGPLNPANMALGCGFFDMVLITGCPVKLFRLGFLHVSRANLIQSQQVG